MNAPLVSVIIPVYNVEAYLEKCLLSISSQTYKNIEIIIINDGSTDNSSSIIHKYENLDERILVLNKQNGGLSDARNQGLEVACGEFLIFVDSDDILDVHTIEKNIVYFESQEEIDIVHFPVRFYSLGEIGGYFYKTDQPQVISNTLIAKKILQGKDLIAVWGKMYRKTIFDNVRFPKGQISEDLWVIPLLYSKCRNIYLSDQGLYLYTQRVDSIVSSKNTILKFSQYMLAYRNYIDDMYAYFPSLKKEIALAEFNIYRNGVKESRKYMDERFQASVKIFLSEVKFCHWINIVVLKRVMVLAFLSFVSFTLGEKKYNKLKTKLK